MISVASLRDTSVLPLDIVSRRRLHPVLLGLTLWAFAAPASALTISVATTFASLDGSVQDADGIINGTLKVGGPLVIATGGSITNNDPGAPNLNDSAGPIGLLVSGDLTVQAGGAIYAENRNSGGSGGAIQITVGGKLQLSATSGANAGGIISSSRTTDGGSGDGGNITMSITGACDLQTGSIVAAANRGGGKAGDIQITAGGKTTIDGLVSSGPSTTVLATKLTGFVLDGGNTTQRGGKITIICNSTVTTTNQFVVTGNGVIVSQGQDPASDKVLLQSCGLEVNGLVASVGKKSNGSNGNSPQVALYSGRSLIINGQNLGGAGIDQGRVRADYVIGEAHVANEVDAFASSSVLINGPASGEIYAVTAYGGSATNQDAGTIDVISMRSTVTTTGKALQGNATTGGGIGGTVLVDALSHIEFGTASIQAEGANSGGGHQAGGHITARSFTGHVAGAAGGELNATGGAGKATPTPGVVTLRGATGVTYLGTSTPAFTNPGAPSGGPTLPAGVTLPNCETIPVPVLLAVFEAQPLDGGIQLRWRFQDAADVQSVRVQRSLDSQGPWSPVAAPIQAGDGVSMLVDRAVQPDRTYYYRLLVTDRDGQISNVGLLSAGSGHPYGQIALAQVGSNPAYGVAHLEFTLPRAADVELVMHDVRGREVAQLAGGHYATGRYQISWSGKKDGANPAPSGVYFASLSSGGKTLVHRIVFVR